MDIIHEMFAQIERININSIEYLEYEDTRSMPSPIYTRELGNCCDIQRVSPNVVTHFLHLFNDFQIYIRTQNSHIQVTYKGQQQLPLAYCENIKKPFKRQLNRFIDEFVHAVSKMQPGNSFISPSTSIHANTLRIHDVVV